MKYNPKVVPFDRSAAYVHHRALKNMRDNNPVDALELMRHAVEHSPDNQEYLLDLAEMYCEMGCHEQSNRILLDMIARENAPAECYYGLALNQFGKNELESARRALELYRKHAKDGEYIEDASNLAAEMDFVDAMKKSPNRKTGRALRSVDRAREALKDDDAVKACRILQRGLSHSPNQSFVRAFYAMALRLAGDDQGALREAEACAALKDTSVRTLCSAAQVFWMCGKAEKGRALMERAIAKRPEDIELRMMIFALCEMEMYAEAAEALKTALRETPHNKYMLHLRAVTLHRAGVEDSQAAAFWVRILRIDPQDSIARFYRDAALRNALGENEPELVYEVPTSEYRRRLIVIADALAKGTSKIMELWREDPEFRELLIWAVGTGEEECGRAAATIIAMVGDAESESILREIFYRGEISPIVKMRAALMLQMRGVELRKFMPPGTRIQDGLLPEANELLAQLPVGERQLVRFSAEILELEYGIRATTELAMLWYGYRSGCATVSDPLVCTQEAAAALAWNFLLQRNVKVSVGKLAEQFGCRERRMVFYARRIAAVVDRDGRELLNEDH